MALVSATPAERNVVRTLKAVLIQFGYQHPQAIIDDIYHRRSQRQTAPKVNLCLKRSAWKSVTQNSNSATSTPSDPHRNDHPVVPATCIYTRGDRRSAKQPRTALDEMKATLSAKWVLFTIVAVVIKLVDVLRARNDRVIEIRIIGGACENVL